MLHDTAVNLFKTHALVPKAVGLSPEYWKVNSGPHHFYWEVNLATNQIRDVQYWWNRYRKREVITPRCNRVSRSRWLYEFIEVATAREFAGTPLIVDGELRYDYLRVQWDSSNGLLCPSWRINDGDKHPILDRKSELYRLIDGALRREVPMEVVWDAVTDHYCTST